MVHKLRLDCCWWFSYGLKATGDFFWRLWRLCFWENEGRRAIFGIDAAWYMMIVLPVLLILQESVFIRATPQSILPSIKANKSEQQWKKGTISYTCTTRSSCMYRQQWVNLSKQCFIIHMLQSYYIGTWTTVLMSLATNRNGTGHCVSLHCVAGNETCNIWPHSEWSYRILVLLSVCELGNKGNVRLRQQAIQEDSHS